MDYKTTIGLVVLVILVGVVWFVTSGPPSPAEPNEPPVPAPPGSAEEPLFADYPERDEVQTITFERAGEPTMVFERIPADEDTMPGATWRMTAPVPCIAETSQVSALIGAARALRARSSFQPGAAGAVSLADAGLEPPVAALGVSNADGKTWTLEIGKTALMSTDTYVRVGGAERVQIAARDLTQMVKRPLEEYRNKKIAQIRVNDVTRLQIVRGDTTYDFSRVADEWVVNQPIRAYVDADKMKELLRRFNNLRAESFATDTPETLEPYGLANPYLTATITTTYERPLAAAEPDASETQPAEPQTETVTRVDTLSIGGYAGLTQAARYVVVNEPLWVATIKNEDADGFLPNLDELRDPRVTRVSADDLSEITLATAAGEVTLTRADGRWQGRDDLAPLDPDAVQALVDAVADLRAVSYIDQPQALSEYGLDAPRATLTISATGLVTPLTLRVGRPTPSGRNAYVQRAGEPTVLVTSAAQAERLAVTPLSLRSRDMIEASVEKIERITIERGGATYVAVSTESGWQLEEPAGAPIDPEGIINLTVNLARLRAAEIMAGATAAYGLDAPTTRITFEAAVGEAPATQPSVPAPPTVAAHTVRLAWHDGAAYAGVDDDPHVFRLEDSVYEALTRELIDTRVFDFKPGLVTGVIVTTPRETLELRKAGADWEYAPEPYLTLDQQKVKDLLQALVDLRAKKYEAWQGADLAAYNLVDTGQRVEVIVGDGTNRELRIGPERPGELSRLAGRPDGGRVFLLSDEDVAELSRGLDWYLQTEEQ